MTGLPLLDARAMATFAARGFLRMDGVAPQEINAQFMAEVGEIAAPEPGRKLRRTYGEVLARAAIPEVPAGTPLARAYRPTMRPAAGRMSPSTPTRTPPSTRGGPSTCRSCTTRTR